MEAPADRDQAVVRDGAGAAATQAPTCQWRPSDSFRELECRLPVDSAHPSLCILHAPAEGKDPERFDQALRQKLKEEEDNDFVTEINLAGVVFPPDADFQRWVFKKTVTFAEAQFRGAAGFEGAHFCGEADFGRAHFVKEANFRYAQFGGEADFGNAQFGGEVHFGDALFSREADFTGALLQSAVSFTTTWFPPADSQATVYFTALAADSARQLRFEDVNLSRVSFLNTDVSRVQLVGCTWAKRTMPLFWPLPLRRPRQTRTVIYDELVIGQSQIARSLVALLYRQLRLNYEASRQEAEAGHFYIGQMEMRRQDSTDSPLYSELLLRQNPSYPLLYRWMLAVYRVLAMYGESYLRPPFFYLLFGAVFALAYLWGGFQVGQAQVKYQWLDLDWGNAVPFSPALRPGLRPGPNRRRSRGN